MTGGRASAGGPKKPAGGAAAAAKSAYDDVFGGPPRYAVPFAARPDDYSEIFGGLASSCSIPVLDLPPALGGLDGAPLDARGSGFDYAEIFSGFDGAEFAVPYQAFAEPKRVEISCSNEREQRRTGFGPQVTEVSEFPPKHPNGDSVACPEEDQFLSYSDHSDDGSKQFNMSYNKTSQGNIEDAISGRTHVTQLDAVPGFTTVVDGCDFLQNHTSSNSPDMVNGEIADLDQGKKVLPYSSGDSTKGTGSDLKADQKLYATKLSASQNGHAEVKHHSRSSSNHSTSMEDVSPMDSTYLTVSEISLRTQPQRVPAPSRPPPMLFNNRGPSTVKTHANSRADLPKVKLRRPISNHQTRYGVASSKSHANKEFVKDNSPPFFDVEVDASSAAAAMKEAMELAEARLKIAKESMERKCDNLQSHKRLDHHQAAKCKERKVENAAQEAESFNLVQTQKKVVKEDKKINGIASEGRNDVISETKIALDYEEKERDVVSAEEDQQSMQEEFFKSFAVSHNLENVSGKLRTNKEFCELIDEEKKDKMAREASEQNIIMKNAKETTMICEDEGNVDEDAGWAYEFTGIGKLVEDDGNSERAKDITKLKDGNISCREGEIKEVPDMIPEACVHKEKKDVLEEDQDPDQEENQNLGEVQEAYVNEEEVKKQYTSDNAPACGESEMMPKLSDAACKFEGNYASRHEERKLEAAKEACEREANEKKLSTTDIRWVPCKHEHNLNMDCKTGIQDEIEKEIEVPPGSYMSERGEEMEAAQAGSQCEDSEEARIKGKVECHYAGNEHRSEETWAQHEQEESKKVNATEETCLWVKNELKLKVASEADNLEGDLKIHETAVGVTGHEEQEKKTGLSKEAFRQDCNEMKTLDAQLEFVQNDKRQEGDQAPLQLKNDQAIFESGHWETRSKDIKEVYVAPDIMEGVKKLNGAREVFQKTLNTVIEDVWQASLLAEKVKIPCSAQDSLESSTLASDDTGEDVQESSLLAKRDKIPSSAQDAMKSSDLVSDRTGEDVQQASLLTKKGKILSSARDAMNSRDMALNRTGEDVQQASLLTNKGKTPSSVQDTVKSSALESDKTASNLCKTEERKHERRIEREMDQVKEQDRNLEEEKEREREREKDRLAVERAIQEAHERAFAEARERAERIAVERVTAEAKQRALTGAREKAEKSNLEAQERSIAEKALREARLRAERAAVERATAEARARAVEKALAEKAASEARECKERFDATSSCKMRKDNIAEDYFKTRVKGVQDVAHGAQFQSTSSSSTCQRNSDFNSQAEGESNLRYKASLERHQRTIERAAKALAEKNMRDLLAQREQAERNRLAEHLDAEVKRWSNGKEGNLRALLSTLQYILGPESGWQPIPLTDVITAAAVKKAYRKATLCVHPDKLQQRGASIQQKYICEKVFDLLKESWNRFGSEE